MSVITTQSMLQAVAFARQNSHPHVTVCFLQPSPGRTVHYGDVAAYLLQEGGELCSIAADEGSTLQVCNKMKLCLENNYFQVCR